MAILTFLAFPSVKFHKSWQRCYDYFALRRASDRVRKKVTNYAEIFRNIMGKKVLIMRKTRWIMRKIFMQPK